MPPHPLTNFEIQKYNQNDAQQVRRTKQDLMVFIQEIIYLM